MNDQGFPRTFRFEIDPRATEELRVAIEGMTESARRLAESFTFVPPSPTVPDFSDGRSCRFCHFIAPDRQQLTDHEGTRHGYRDPALSAKVVNP